MYEIVVKLPEETAEHEAAQLADYVSKVTGEWFNTYNPPRVLAEAFRVENIRTKVVYP